MRIKFLMATAVVSGVLLFNSCKKADKDLPAQTFPFAVVNTSAISNTGETTADCGGTVSSEGTSAITAVGICWDTNPLPTTLSPHTYAGAGVGTFKSQLTGLESDTKYYVRSYATNALGTKYGEEVSFKTLPKWITLLPANFSKQVNSILMNNSNMYLAISGIPGGVKKSNDNGNTFVDVNSGLNNNDVYSLISNGPTIFAGTSNGVYSSSNGGANWSPSSVGMPNGTSVYLMQTNGTNLFACTYSGLFVSNNNGGLWTAVTTTLTNFTSVNDVAVIGQKVFFATNNKIFVTSDNGLTWSMVTGGLPPTMFVGALHVKGSSIFASGNQGLYVSNNNGDDWTAVTTSGLFSATAMVHLGDKLIAGTQNSGTQLSYDDGKTWSPINGGLQYTTITALGVAGNAVFAATNQGTLSKKVFE